MSYPPQPPYVTPSTHGNRRAVLFGVLAVALVLLLTIGGAALALAGGDDDGDRRAAVAGDPATGSAEPTPTEPEPEPTTEAPTPTESPDPAPPSGGRLTSAEYTKDWNFQLDDVKLDAKHVAGWDYKTCGPVSKGGKLDRLGCRYAVEVTYKALGGRLQFTHLFLAMPDEKTATRVVNKEQITDAHFALRDESFLPKYATGKYKDNSGASFVVVTVATARAGVADKQVSDYLNYANADFSSALLFRF